MEDVVKGVGGEYTGNYTGPYWSNGKVQPSVEWGDLDPTSELDFLSRQHDSAYAHFKDAAHRTAADRYYNEQAKKLAGQFPQIAGNIVLYGNEAKRSFERTATNVGNGSKFFGLPGAVAGLVYTAAGNIVRSNQMLNGTYLKKEALDVLNYYKTDPLGKKQADYSAPIKTTTKVNNPSMLVGGPSSEDNRKAALIAAQARKFQNFAALKENSDKSKQQNIDTEIPVWNMHGYQGRHKKRRKKNKIHLEPIRL